MKNLINWELKQTFQSKYFWGFGIVLTLMNTVFLIITSVDGGKKGFELFIQGCSDFNSFILLFIGRGSGFPMCFDGDSVEFEMNVHFISCEVFLLRDRTK